MVSLSIKSLENLVKNKIESFVNMGVWPAGEKLRPFKWLKNFKDFEKEHALYLLNSFTYYNLEMAIALLKGSILQLSAQLPYSNTISEQLKLWNQFLANSIFVPVTGENRNLTDSGNILAGHLRRDLLIPQSNILDIQSLYDADYKEILSGCEDIVFFDDFIGSGQQFLTMMLNKLKLNGVSYECVKERCKSLNLKIHYCAMIATQYGSERIQSQIPEVDLHFSYLLKQQLSPLGADSLIWPEHLKHTSLEFILNSSRRAGIPENEIRGFHNLGLALAFSFTIPDATLPLFSWSNDGWSALMEKN